MQKKKMLKTLRMQNQTFKIYKKLVFMLPVYLIQHPQARLLKHSLITWSSGSFFPSGQLAERQGGRGSRSTVPLKSGYPVPHDPCWAEQWLRLEVYFTSLDREWQSPALSSPTSSSTLPSHYLHVHLLPGPQHISYRLVPLFINPVFTKQNTFLPLFAS